jgi:hypothetical protein
MIELIEMGGVIQTRQPDCKRERSEEDRRKPE